MPRTEATSESLSGGYEINERNERSPDDIEERAAIIEEGANVPRQWAEGYAALCAMPPPAGFSSQRWARIVDAAGTFIDRWAVRAAELGWTDRDVFGCDAAAPTARFDQIGMVVLLERMHVETRPAPT